MADNQEPTELQEGTDGAASSSGKPIMIPKSRYDVANQRATDERIAKEAALAEMQVMRQKLEALSGQKPTAAQPADAGSAPTPTIKPETASDTEERLARLELAQVGLTGDAAQAVREVQKRLGVSLEEAVVLAKHRKPEAFGDDKAAGFNRDTHSTLPPGRGPRTPQQEPVTESQRLRSITNRQERHREAMLSARERIKSQMGVPNKFDKNGQ